MAGFSFPIYVFAYRRLSCAPRKFTKLLKSVLFDLHLRGHISSAYIDDMYLQGRSYRDCVNNVIDSVKHFDSLGLIAHPHKCYFRKVFCFL